MTDCCEPGCTRETRCPVHQALADLRAKARDLPSRVELDEVGNEVTWVRYADVLALFEKESNEHS